MKGPRKLWITVFVLGAAGLSLFIILLLRHDMGQITTAFAKAGWGVLAVVAFHFIVLLCNAFAWPPDLCESSPATKHGNRYPSTAKSSTSRCANATRDAEAFGQAFSGAA